MQHPSSAAVVFHLVGIKNGLEYQKTKSPTLAGFLA